MGRRARDRGLWNPFAQIRGSLAVVITRARNTLALGRLTGVWAKPPRGSAPGGRTFRMKECGAGQRCGVETVLSNSGVLCARRNNGPDHDKSALITDFLVPARTHCPRWLRAAP